MKPMVGPYTKYSEKLSILMLNINMTILPKVYKVNFLREEVLPRVKS